MNVKLELRERYHEFSKTNKRIVDFIIQQPNQFLEMTALEIAEQCQTSSASVIRFVQMLEFSGLDNFKIALAMATDIQENKEYIDPIISKDDDVRILCEKVNTLITESNADFFYQLNVDDLDKSIEIIRNSRKIYLLGIGASSLPAYDLYHKFNRVNINAVFNFDAHMTVEFFNYLTPEDTVIAFSYSGQTLEVIYPAEIAKSKGAKIISITRKEVSKLSILSDINLTVPNNEHVTRVGAITSKLTTMILADILYLGAIQNGWDSIEKDLFSTNSLTKVLKIKDNGD